MSFDRLSLSVAFSLLAFLSPWRPAPAQSPHVPAIVVNGGTTPYVGTAVFGLPAPSEVELDVGLIDARLESGAPLLASVVASQPGANGRSPWLLTAVTGVFPPGETVVYLGRTETPSPQFFVPDQLEFFADLTIEITEIDWETRDETTAIIDPLTASYRPLHVATNYGMARFFGVLPSGLKWELLVSARQGEHGIRCELLLHNDTRPDFEPGLKRWHQIRRAAIRTRNPGASGSHDADAGITIARGFNPSNPNTILGKLGIVDGRYLGPLKLYEDEVTGSTICEWITEESAIPMGAAEGNRYTAPGRPGDPPAVGHDPRTAEGFIIVGGQKVAIEFFVGDSPPQEHLDCPPGIVWADGARYVDHLVGGGAPSGGQFTDPDRARYDRILRAIVDPTLCDSLPGHNPNTLWGFIERGGTYAKPHRDNPHFGLRDFGDVTWASGYAGANHYQMATHLFHGYLATRDHRFLVQARQRVRHFRTIDWIHETGEPTQFQGKSRYEKGSHHGNYSDTRPGHLWTRVLGLDYVLTGHPESRNCLDQVRRYLLEHERFDGGAVSPVWVSAGNDPRNWGAPTTFPGGTEHRGGSAASGWQGDWGLRIPGRTLSMLVDDTVFLGRDNTDAIHHVIDQVLRVEQGIWGGQGFILNRSQRSGGVLDHETTWSALYLIRAIGRALRDGGDIDPAHVALYHRMVDFMEQNGRAYGLQPNGMVIPMRPETRYGAEGPMRIYRPGLSTHTIDAWFEFKNAQPSATAWFEFSNRFKANLVELQAIDAPVLRMSAFLEYKQTIAEVDQIFSSGQTFFGGSLLRTLILGQWRYLELSGGPQSAHAALLADLFAQAVLDFGREDLRGLAEELWRTCLWHSVDGENPTAYLDIRDNPSPVGYRNTMFPTTEDKHIGVQLDVMNALRLSETLAPAIRSVPPLRTFE